MFPQVPLPVFWSGTNARLIIYRAPSGPHFCYPADTISDTLNPRLWYMSPYYYRSHEQALLYLLS